MHSKFAHVWPLVDGLPGVDALHRPVTLVPLTRGLMPIEEARKHEAEGNLVFMAGKSPTELYLLKRKPGTYQTAEAAPESEPEPEVVETQKPSVPRRPPGRPRKAKAPTRYKRRDIVAENSQ